MPDPTTQPGNVTTEETRTSGRPPENFEIPRAPKNPFENSPVKAPQINLNVDQTPQPAGTADTQPVGDWDIFYSDDTIVLYFPAYKQIVFLKDSTGSASQKILLFDIPTRSWVRGNDQFTYSTPYSNSVIDSNGNTVVIEGSSTVRKWDDEATPTGTYDMDVQWRDETFDQIGVKKKVYSIAMKYKCSTNNENIVQYASDGDGSFTQFGTATLATAAAWDTVVFEPTTPVTCESIQFRITAMEGTFEIDDLSIEYRVLPYARVT